MDFFAGAKKRDGFGFYYPGYLAAEAEEAEGAKEVPMETDSVVPSPTKGLSKAARVVITKEERKRANEVRKRANDEMRARNEHQFRVTQLAKTAVTWAGRDLFRTSEPVETPDMFLGSKGKTLGLVTTGVEDAAFYVGAKRMRYEEAALFMRDPVIPWDVCKVCGSRDHYESCVFVGVDGVTISCSYKWCSTVGKHLIGACPALNGRCSCGKRGHLDPESAGTQAVDGGDIASACRPCKHPQSKEWYEASAGLGWLSRMSIKSKKDSRYRAAAEFNGPTTYSGAWFRDAHPAGHLLEATRDRSCVTEYLDERYDAIEPLFTERVALHALAAMQGKAAEAAEKGGQKRERSPSRSSQGDQGSTHSDHKRGRYHDWDDPSSSGYNPGWKGKGHGKGSRSRSRNRGGGGYGGQGPAQGHDGGQGSQGPPQGHGRGRGYRTH